MKPKKPPSDSAATEREEKKSALPALLTLFISMPGMVGT